ncbi:MAG: HD domain-containing phosphohydrolase [Candidatus Ozemobacteraceae bacterium]
MPFDSSSLCPLHAGCHDASTRTEWRISVFDLLSSLSEVTDWISSELTYHHRQVAYLAWNIGEEVGLSSGDLDDLVMAALVHDIGAISLKERLETLDFELTTGLEHAEQGYLLLRRFEPLARAAVLTRYHHLPWQNAQGEENKGNHVPIGSHILQLADRIAVLIDRRTEILGQVARVQGAIEPCAGFLFKPELVDAFHRRSVQEALWLDLVSPSLEKTLRRVVPLKTLNVDIDGLLRLGNLLRCIIDFRSPFTATHSTGVAETASSLAEFMKLPEQTCRLLRVAGFIHDLGKLGVPTEILEKPGKLTTEEFQMIRHHPYGSIRALEAVSDLREITAWGALHHERMDGSGYPFHLFAGKLPLEARIMAVADVFTAITENRPYRSGMEPSRVKSILQGMTTSLDQVVVEVLIGHYELIDQARRTAQQSSIDEYKGFLAGLGQSHSR